MNTSVFATVAAPALPYDADTNCNSLAGLVHAVAGWAVAAQAELSYGTAQSREELSSRLDNAEAALRTARARLAETDQSHAGSSGAYCYHVSHVIWSATSALVAAQCEIGAGGMADVETLEARLSEAAEALALAQSRVAEIRATGRVRSYADIVRDRKAQTIAKRAATIAAKVCA